MDTSVAVGKAPRRMRTVEEKFAIVAHSLEPGVSVAAVARQHGVNANLLFAWRRLHEQGLLEAHTRSPRTPARLANHSMSRVESFPRNAGSR